MTLGPIVTATTTGVDTIALYTFNNPVTATGVSAKATGAGGAGGEISGGTVSDSSFTGEGVGLILGGATARRVVASGGVGLVGFGGLVSDSLVIGTDAEAVRAPEESTLQLRNLTAVSAAAAAAGIVAEPGGGGKPGARIVAKNMIVRGGSSGTDVVAVASDGYCQTFSPCAGGSADWLLEFRHDEHHRRRRRLDRPQPIGRPDVRRPHGGAFAGLSPPDQLSGDRRRH